MIRIGIICPSEIALRRFLPALSKLPDFKFIGVAIADKSEWEGANDDTIKGEKEKAAAFIQNAGGKIFESYANILESNQIDAVYLPLPPALHFRWAKLALLNGKHILVEKPATSSYSDTKDLIYNAGQRNLAFNENYMFAYHNQLDSIRNIVESGEIGEVRLYRISFGFPRRNTNDFRYNKKLGGGALLDCGGYTIKYASILLGQNAKIICANSNYITDFDVDIYGSATLVNEHGTTSQISFGMDNGYKCDLEVWGSKGFLTSGRVLTAPAGFVPEVTLNIGNNTETRKLPEDDAFMKSIYNFQKCIENETVRKINYDIILKQSELVDEFSRKAKKN